MSPRVVLVAACDAEWSRIRGSLGVAASPPRGEVVAARGDVGLLRLGVGLQAAASSVQALERCGPAVVVHVGFAGGLRTGITAGSLLLVTGVSAGVYAPGAVPPVEPVDTDLVDALRARLAVLPDRLSQGALLTVDRFIDRATDKGALGRSTPYIACEMEASVVRAACARAGARYAGVRAISDAEHESVPPVSLRGALRGAGTARRAIKWATRPQAPLEAWNFVQGGRRARRALGRAIPVAVDVALEAAARR